MRCRFVVSEVLGGFEAGKEREKVGRKERGRERKDKKREKEERETHIPLEHDLPPLDLFVAQPRPFLQLLPRLAPPRRRIARKHSRVAEVSRFEDEDRGGVVACREGGSARGGGLSVVQKRGNAGGECEVSGGEKGQREIRGSHTSRRARERERARERGSKGGNENRESLRTFDSACDCVRRFFEPPPPACGPPSSFTAASCSFSSGSSSAPPIRILGVAVPSSPSSSSSKNP